MTRKVLHVLNGAGGGAAMSTIDLMKALRARGVESCAVCHDAGTPVERERLREAAGGEVAFVPLYFANRKIRAALWKRPLIELRQIVHTGWTHRSASLVAERFRSWGADIIHTNNILTPEGGLAARAVGSRHVWHLRELVGAGQPFRLRHEGPALGRYLMDHSSIVVANSNAAASRVERWLPPGRLTVVPNGIDVNRFAVRAPGASGSIVVAMVGNLTSRVKKHRLFVEAAALVSRALPIQFRVYGHEAHGDAYTDMLHARVAELDLRDRFVWSGFVGDPAAIMKDVDVVVQPSDEESFGRVVVEAMAAGLPVAAVRGGGAVEIVVAGETGLFSPPDDAAGLARSIERLAQNPELRRNLGAAGRTRAEKNYSLEACAERIHQVYETARSGSRT